VDYSLLVAQAVRARRGARTQKQLSRGLGYRSNAVFAWENGHDEPSALSFFRLVEKTGPLPDLGAWVRGQELLLTTREGISSLLNILRNGRKISEIARSLGEDRHKVGRWLRGQTDISMADLLRYVQWSTLSLFDFLATFVDPSELEEARVDYASLQVAREAAKKIPWAHAILQMVNLPSYKTLCAHQPGWFASRLSISIEEERECLEHLVGTGQLELCDGRYRGGTDMSLDTRTDPSATRRLASFWLSEASRRVQEPGRGRFAFNTFAVSSADLKRLHSLQSEYFQRLRTIVSESEKTEAVAVVTFALMPLSVEGVSSDE
jgi:transcriptional regulator with XRE-family HTH domain